MKTRSKNGVMIDFGALIAQSGATIAVGNAGMNARGDQLSHGGIVDKTAEQIADAYYKTNPRAVTHTVALGSIEDELLSPADAMNLINGGEAAAPKARRKTTDE